MPKFQLTSEYAPAGDQPKAIEQLTAGFAGGKKVQVLLGATGTGKSLAWDEPVLVRFPNRAGRPVSLLPMGEFIDAAFAAAPGLRDASGTEVTTPREPVEAFSFDADTCEAGWKPVTAVSRHAPPAMFRVRTGCGREVVVTGDHNFFRLRDGQLELTETADLGDGDFLPLPRTVPTAGVGLDRLDLLDLFAGRDDVVVDSPDVFAWVIERAGWDRVRPILARFYTRPGQKRYAALVEGSDPALTVRLFGALLAELDLAPPAHLPLEVRAAGCRSGARLPRFLPVGADLLSVLGLMLAEGHCQSRYSVFSCYDADVRAIFFGAAARLGIPTAVRPSSDVQISSRLWTDLFRLLVGGKSREKHLPAFWPNLSAAQLGVFLRAYYEGDGGVERPQVTVTTASRRLASEIGYALTCLGFWPRLRRRWKRATNTAHAGAWYHSVAVSGREDLARFAETVGFLSAAKTDRLRALREASGEANTNVDVMPVGGARLRYLRETAGVAKGPLARAAGRSRGAVQLIEKQARHPSRTTLAALLGGLSDASAGAIESDEVFRDARNLLNARWTPVAAVEPVEYDRPFVYDFTVADNETFLAGHGGLFVHNTFTASCMIEKLQKPTLVLAHNKTLAAQLYKEFKGFFKNNAVHYFVSYYDYYQPEAYIPQRDIYIEKDSSINENIDRLRLAATSALVSREDVIIVASVSCIYGLGSPTDYKRMMVYIKKGDTLDRDNTLLRLIDIQYKRNDIAFERGTVRVRGDTIDVWPASEEFAYRVELFGDEVETLSVIHPVTGESIRTLDDLYIYPAKHFVTPEDRVQAAIKGIEDELNARLEQFKNEGKILEMERLKARCRYDLDMLREVGYCSGVENYARWFSGRAPGEAPYTLIDFFPDDFFLVVDESHVSLPQVRGMYFGDRARKETLVEHGFRLPSALDNRPLKFDEFEKRLTQCLCLSATPGPYELEKVGGEVVEQVIRPTGLVDPVIHVKPARGQVKDLEAEVRTRAERGERALVTVLTKRMCEDLTTYFRDAGMRCKWLHSELDAIERIQVLRELREGAFDVLIGVNLLREGLDLPEVSLVAILDADKEGFLRSDKSLIQTMGRAARNVNAEVILYADTVTDSMSRAMNETSRRREIQLAYNVEHNITPKTVKTAIKNEIEDEIEAHKLAQEAATGSTAAAEDYVTVEYVQGLYAEMLESAKGLDFERAQALRDQIVKLETELKKKHGDAVPPSVLGGKAVPVSQPVGAKKKGKWKRGQS